jgi:hypothetical protein
MHGPTHKLEAIFASRTVKLSLGVAALSFFSIGCAITDYRGYLNHRTSIGPIGVGNPDIFCVRGDKDSDKKGSDKDSDKDSDKRRAKCGEAKLFGSQVASVSGDPDMDGTYDYTVAYDFRGRTTPIPPTGRFPNPVDITTYRNRVVGAFNSDGRVDRDGDDLRWNSGNLNGTHDPADPAGIWERRFLYRDRAPGCQFAANFKKAYADDRPRDKNGDPSTGDNDVPDPAILLCFDSPQEEIDDQDQSLQCGFRGGHHNDDSDGAEGSRRGQRSNDPNPATPACRGRRDKDSDKDSDKDTDDDNNDFASIDALAKQLWSGALNGSFSVDLVGFDVIKAAGGSNAKKVVSLSEKAEGETEAAGLRPTGFTLDITSPGGQALIKALLANTSDNEAFRVNARFSGGMTVESPKGMTFRVSHADLEALLK